MTLTFNLRGHGACRWCGSMSSIRIPTLKCMGLTVRKIWHILWVCVSRPVTLTFDLFYLQTGAQCSRCHGVPSCQVWLYYDYSFSIFMGHWANAAQTDHMTLGPCSLTLTFDLGGHGACGWCGLSSTIRIHSMNFVGLATRTTWRTMCVSIYGPVDPDLWLFDLETGVRVASKMGNLPFKFGHARPLSSRIIRYVRDGRTDRRTDTRTDGQKQCLLPLPFGPGIITGSYAACIYRSHIITDGAICECDRVTEQNHTATIIRHPLLKYWRALTAWWWITVFQRACQSKRDVFNWTASPAFTIRR